MFFLIHPKPVRPRKAVPEQQVSSRHYTQIDTKTIIVEHSTENLRTLQSKYSTMLADGDSPVKE